MSKKSQTKKITFVLVFLALIFLAAFTAHKFKVYAVDEYARTNVHVSSTQSENAFFGLFLGGFILLLRNTGSSGKFLELPPFILVGYTYASSIFFTLFSMFISPINALVNIIIYFVPVLLWHQKKLKTWIFILLSLTLAGISIAYFQKIGSFLLLLPTLHLIAIRANNSLKSRYAGDSKRIHTQLSSTQRQQIKGSIFGKNFDWWAIVEPELDALLESWSKVYSTTRGVGYSSGERSLEDSFVSLQNYNELNKAKQTIIGRDPKFSTEKFINRFTRTFKQITTACTNHNIAIIQPMVSDALYEQFKCRVDEQKKAGIKFKLTGIEVLHTEIKRIATNGEFDELHIYVGAVIKETAIDMVTKKTLSADKDTDNIVHELWTFIRRSTAKTLERGGLAENQCPNCGNPIKIGQATLCSACNSYIRSGNFDWVLSQITQSGEWSYSNPNLLANWKQLNEQDKHLAIQQIEDKAAVIFWMLKSAELSRNSEALLRYATPECNELLNKFLFASKVKYNCNESISLGGVSLKGVAIRGDNAQLYLLITWSGIPVRFDEKGRVPTVHRFVKPYRDVFVLTRKLAAKTKVENTLSSAHCFNCGGPLTSSFDAKCSYCSTVLNDGTEWILDKILKENNSEYQMVMQKAPSFSKFKKSAANTKKTDDKSFVSPDLPIRSGHEMIAIAASIMVADGVIDDAEMDLLKKVGKKYRMPETTVMGILESVKLGEFPPVDSLCRDHDEIIALVDMAIEMALADGEICPKEKEAIITFAKNFNYIEADINIRIGRVMREKGLTKKPDYKTK